MLLCFLKFFVKLFYRVDISGEYQGGVDNGQEKTLIIANHSSFIDAVLLLLVLPETPVFVIHRETESSLFFRLFLRRVEYITVDPRHAMPLRKVVQVVDSGRPVVIFPEGRMTVTGTLMKLYSGAAFVAQKTNATIIPVQITGAKFSHFSRLGRLFTAQWFPKITLNIFPPTTLAISADLAGRDSTEVAREEMQNLMMTMAVDAREPKTLFEMLLEARKVHGKDTFAYADTLSEDLTYHDLVQKSVSLSVLLNRKLKLSNRVGVLLPNSNACILAFYALQHAGKTPVMINYTAGARAVNAGVMAAEAKTILTSRRFVEKGELQPLIDALGDSEIVYLEDLRKTVSLSDKLVIAAKRSFPRLTSVKQTPDDEALVLFTSGTEGFPKGVLHSHDSLMAQLAQIKSVYDFNPRDKFMLCLPVFHVFGLMSGFVLPIASGASGVLYPSPLHYKVIPQMVYEHNCTVLLSTSTFLSGYARFAESYDLHSLRYVIAGAERLSPEVVKTYHEKFGIRIMEGYGATETAPVIAAETQMAHRRGSVGRLLPGLNHQLVAVEGIDAGGKLVVEGDNVMLGYLRADNPGVLEAPDVGVNGKRLYDTGDIVDIDDFGYVHIKGRVKRFAKIAGEMVSLDTSEKLAVHASSEHQHACVSLSDRRKGEALHLFTTDAELNRKMLQQASKELDVPKLAVPKTIQVVDTIPVFASGKVNYPVLNELIDTVK